MSNEIRALDLISMLLKNYQQTSNSISISFTEVNRFRNNLLLEGICFDLGLYDFEDISYDFPKVSNDNRLTKIIELWEK